MPLNVTPLTPTRLEPENLTGWPITPWLGLTFVTIGGRIVKFPALVPSPPRLRHDDQPVVAVGGTTAVIWVVPLTMKLVAFMPLNLTAVVPPKLVPLIVTFVPETPPDGLNDVSVGVGAEYDARHTLPSLLHSSCRS